MAILTLKAAKYIIRLVLYSKEGLEGLVGTTLGRTILACDTFRRQYRLDSLLRNNIHLHHGLRDQHREPQSALY